VAKSNLAVRLLTACLVAPLLVALMFLGPAWAWYGVVLLASGVGAAELFGMTHADDRAAQLAGVLATLATSATLYFAGHDPRALATLLLVIPIAGLLFTLLRLGAIESAAARATSAIAGPLYVGGLLTTIGLLRRDQGEAGGAYVLFTLMIAWLGDTGGYFFGRYFGKTKLYEAVSPNKTREGFAGSLAGSSVGALLAHFWFLPSLPLLHAIGLALVAGALGQLGDLAESMLKRSTGVKDSGWIIPGHGGILDRIDAVLIASPVVYLYTLWFTPRAG
jgi:phosphatidate cytidylyltransferase